MKHEWNFKQRAEVFFRAAIIAGVLFIIPATSRADTLTLSQGGISAYDIVVPAVPTNQENIAARDLQQYLNQITGGTFVLRKENEAAVKTGKILVGATTVAKTGNFDPSSLGYDGIKLASSASDLIIVGDPPRGTIYAVNTFLEDFIGVRWWTPSESFVPNKPTLKIVRPSVTFAPPFEGRLVVGAYNYNGDFNSHMRCNGQSLDSTRNAPVRKGAIDWHSFDRLIPASWFTTHPEWFSMRSGQRQNWGAGGQLCMTNMALKDQIVSNCIDSIRKYPAAEFLTITQNDNNNYCQCPACVAMDSLEGGQSGTYLRFVNACAEAIGAQYPTVTVETFAYQYTRKPPKITRPRSNVAIRLCPIEASFAHPINHAQNAAFMADFSAWAAIVAATPCRGLAIWDYYANYANFIEPYPCTPVIGANLRLYRANQVKDLLLQTNHLNWANTNNTGIVGDFAMLKTYILCHMAWNPDYDQKSLENDYITGYFGAAAPSIRTYLDIQEAAVLRSSPYLSIGMVDHTRSWLTLDDLNRMTTAMNSAVSAAGADQAVVRRVLREKLCLDEVWVHRGRGLSRKATEKNLVYGGPTDFAAHTANFIVAANSFGLQQQDELSWWGNNGDMVKDTGAYNQYQYLLTRNNAAIAPLLAPYASLTWKQFIEIQDAAFDPYFYTRVTSKAKWVPDAAASDGWTARTTGDNSDWMTGCILDDPDNFDVGRSYTLVVSVRADVNAGVADAVGVMQMGLYDSNGGPSISTTFTAGQIRGTSYKQMVVGSFIMPAKGIRFWASPNSRADVPFVYVDRIALIPGAPTGVLPRLEIRVDQPVPVVVYDLRGRVVDRFSCTSVRSASARTILARAVTSRRAAGIKLVTVGGQPLKILDLRTER